MVEPHRGQPSVPHRRTITIEAPRELYVARQLHELGVSGYEPETAAVMLGLAEVLAPSVVFDVGANVGPHALLVPALLDVPVVAFEASPAIAEVLRQLVSGNGLDCVVEELAVGDSNGTAVLFISPTDTSTSLRPGFRTAKAEVRVPLVTLDQFVRTSGHRPGLLKLDTETTEPAVLRGATELLASRPWIVCEVLPGWNEEELEGLLFPLGYGAYHIDAESPLRRQDRIVGQTTLEHMNWLFAPVEPGHETWDAIDRWRLAIDACPPPTTGPAA